MLIDFHTYVGTSMLGSSSSIEDLLMNMEHNKIDASVVCPVKTVDPYFEKQNIYVSELQKKYEGKIYGFARIDPNLETGYPWLSHCFQVANLAEKFPDLTFIMSHGGQFDSSGYALTDVDYVMDRHQNLYIETSGDFSDEGIENIPIRLGYDRLIFGSHFPWLNTELEIYRIERANLPKEAKEAIYYKNAKNILKV